MASQKNIIVITGSEVVPDSGVHNLADSVELASDQSYQAMRVSASKLQTS